MTQVSNRLWLVAGLTCVGTLLVAACQDPEVVVVEITAAERGAQLAADPALSKAPQNHVACLDCHAEAPGDAALYLPGAPLAGATLRPSFWGGQESTLLRSINHCLNYFMAADAPWEGDEEDAVAIYAYLESLEQGADASAAPLTVGAIVDPGSGDAGAGADVYERACASCHGAKSSGAGRLVPSAPTLPEETLSAHPEPDYDDFDRRLVFVEKVRHGGFLGYGGTMPLYSVEVLSDEALADLLTYFGVPEP